MRNIQVVIYLPADLLDTVDQAAADQGSSRSAWIREAIAGRIDQEDQGTLPYSPEEESV